MLFLNKLHFHFISNKRTRHWFCSFILTTKGVGKLPKDWEQPDIDYLEENWGKLSIPVIAKKLGRSTGAIESRAWLLNLGPWKNSCEYMSLRQFSNAMGIHSDVVKKKLTDHNFPLKTKIIKVQEYVVIDIDEFWKWAETHRDVFRFKRLEKGALGKEPPWVDQKRRMEERYESKHMQEWTKGEDALLTGLLKSYRYTYDDLSKRLNRSEFSIKTHIRELGLKERPIRREVRAWTGEEKKQLFAMLAEHASYDEIARTFGRSAQGVRSCLERHLNPTISQKAYRRAPKIEKVKWHKPCHEDICPPKEKKRKKSSNVTKG